MLVPTTREVALSVAVADKEMTGEGLTVEDGIVGSGINAESLWLLAMEEVRAAVEVGASLIVALPDAGEVMAALLGIPDDVEEGPSEVGMPMDWLPEEVGTGTSDVPTEPDGAMDPDGEIPAVGVTFVVLLISGEVLLAVSEGVGIVADDDTTAEGATDPEGKVPEGGRIPDDGTVPVGTTPEEGTTPDGIRLEGRSLVA